MKLCKKEKFNKKDAQTALNHCKKEHRRECRIYYHKECNAWHLTSMEEFEEIIRIPEEELIFYEKWKQLKKP